MKEKKGSMKIRIRRHAEQLMAYDLAVQFSWTGKSGLNDCKFLSFIFVYINTNCFYDLDTQQKRPFSEYGGVIALFGRVVQYQNAMPIPEEEIIEAVQDYFRRAPGRAKECVRRVGSC